MKKHYFKLGIRLFKIYFIWGDPSE